MGYNYHFYHYFQNIFLKGKLGCAVQPAAMKTSSLSSIAVLFCLAASAAQAQVVPGSSADVILQLKLTRTVPDLAPRDEQGQVIRGGRNKALPVFENVWDVNENEVRVETHVERGSQMVSEKYGTKEFLGDLVEIGLISSIQGWSLKWVRPTLGDPADLASLVADEGQYFLVHRNSRANPPIPLSGLIFAEMDNRQAKMSERLIEYYEAGDVLTGSSRTYQEQVRQQMAMLIDFGAYNPEDNVDDSIEMFGLYAGGLRLQSQGPDKQPVFMPSAGKFSEINGQLAYQDLEAEVQDRALVEGGITYTAGKFVPDLSAYDFAANDER